MDGGTAQPADTVMSEAAAPPPQSDPNHQPQQQTGMENIPATLSHGGRFIQYNIFGNIFEVTAKYKPPIMPIGKGAYGIVWSLSLSLVSPFDWGISFSYLLRNLQSFLLLESDKNMKCIAPL